MLDKEHSGVNANHGVPRCASKDLYGEEFDRLPPFSIQAIIFFLPAIPFVRPRAECLKHLAPQD